MATYKGQLIMGVYQIYCWQNRTKDAASADSSEKIEFSLGTLDSPQDIELDVHIFVGSKADWCKNCDGLPQYEGDRTTHKLKDWLHTFYLFNS